MNLIRLLTVVLVLLLGLCMSVSAQRILYLDDVSIDTRSATTREADFLFDKYGKFEPSGQPSEIQIGTFQEGEKVAMIMTKSAFENMTPSSVMMWAVNNFAQHLQVGQGTRFGVISYLKYHEPGEYVINAWDKDYILYAGSWSVPNSDSQGCKCAFHDYVGGYLEFPFNGTGVKVISERLKTHGRSDIYLDGALVDSVDLYSSEIEKPYIAYQVSGLESKQHVLRIQITGKNENATNSYFVLHRFEVTNETATEEVQELSNLISSHNELHKALERATGVQLIRKGTYDVELSLLDSILRIKQPYLEIQK